MQKHCNKNKLNFYSKVSTAFGKTTGQKHIHENTF